MNCHIDDLALRERNAVTKEEFDYLKKIQHPDNPFSDQIEVEMTLSTEASMLVLNTVDNPRNIFCYVKRSNRTLRQSVKKEQEKKEKAHGEVVVSNRLILILLMIKN